MLTPEFIRYEIDAINEKWSEIQKGGERKGEGLALGEAVTVAYGDWNEAVGETLVDFGRTGQPSR